jgi:hypothetical protein
MKEPDKSILLSLVVVLWVVLPITLLVATQEARAQADWLSSAGMTQVMNGVDDGTYHVSLGHSFPYYGGTFTDAWMSSNGVIMLYDPTTQFGNLSYNNSMCCSGQNFSTTTSSAYSFMLAPLWTDLRHDTSVSGSGYFYKTNEGVSSFLWRDVKEYGTNNLNTFQANLWPDGSFDFLYDDVNITNHAVTVGFSGNLDFGDYEQMVHQTGFSNTQLLNGTWWDQLFNPGGVAWYGEDGGYDSSVDCSNALNDSRCPGYAEAYLDQQCTIDSLYSQQCPGYAQAYFTQQCDLDPFYDTTCPGYDQALLLQDMAGTDFVFGDDITDFYDTEPLEETLLYEEETEMFLFEEDETYMFTEEEDYADTGFDDSEFNQGNENGSDGETWTVWDNTEFQDEPTIAEETEEVYGDSLSGSDPVLGGDPNREISEEIALEDEYIEEEITHIEEDVGNIEEELPIEEISTLKINAVDIALTTAARAEINATQIIQEQQSQSVISILIAQETEINETDTLNETQQEFTFSTMDTIIEAATYNMIVDPTITVDIITTVQSSTEQATQQEEETIDFQMESSTPQMDTGFAAQQDQSFSTGQSITAVLNNVAPNFSQFDVAPPSQQEQRQTARAETAANNMSQEQINSSMENMTEEMQESGGFSDQSLTIFLLGRVEGFENYGGQLQDNPFYNDRGLPISRVPNDRNTMLQLIGTSGKHETMIAEQYE